MSFDQSVVERVRNALPKKHSVIEKKMMGGLVFMINGHMCCGVSKNALMVRVGPERNSEMVSKRLVRPLEFGGRRPKGFVLVEPDGYRTPAAMKEWLKIAIEFIETLPPRNSKTNGIQEL